MVNTFVPIAGDHFLDGVWLSLRCLDNKRLGKQRVEAFQIWNTLQFLRLHPDGIDPLTKRRRGWTNHPAVRMWRGFEDALAVYIVIACHVWAHERHFCNDKMALHISKFGLDVVDRNQVTVPFWWFSKVHSSYA